MAPRKVRNPLALAVLALLDERPRHPYDMARTMRERHQHESIKLNYGSLYTVVDRLAGTGLIVARGTVRESARPERTVYDITEAGRQELRGWLRELISNPHKEFRDFEAGLALLGVLPPREALDLLRQRHDRLAEQRLALGEDIGATVAGGVDEVFVVESEYRLALLDAELGFVRRLVDRIENDTAYTRLWREYHRARDTKYGTEDDTKEQTT